MSSVQIPTEGCVTFKAAADLSSYQFHMVKLSTSAALTVTYADANGDGCIGVLMNAPTAAGQAAEVFTLQGGICPCKAGAAITHYGFPLVPDADGECIEASDGDVCVARSIDTAGATNDIIRIMWGCPAYLANVSKVYEGFA